MRATILPPTGDAFKVMFKNENSDCLFTVGISGTVQTTWELKTESELLDAAIRLAERIGAQSSTAPNEEEFYLFTSDNTDSTLEKTLERL